MIQQDEISREEHLARRRNYVGASDAAAAIGMSPYQSPYDLYRQKLGLIQDEPSEAMIRGQVLEPLVLRLYERKMGYGLNPGGWLISKEHDFMAATPDGIDTHINAPIQCKTISAWSRHEWGKPETQDVPDHYFIQTQHEMSVLGVKRNRLVVLFADTETFRPLVHMVKVGLDLDTIADFVEEQHADEKSLVEFSWFPVNRDDSSIADIIEGERIFWFEHVKKENPPPDEKIPEKSKEIIIADEKQRAIMEAMRDASEDVAIAKQKYTEAKTPLKKAIGDKSGITSPDLGTVNYKAGPPVTETNRTAVLVDFSQLHRADYDKALEKHRTIVNEDGVLAEFKILDPTGYEASVKKNSVTTRGPRVMRPYFKKRKRTAK